MNGQREHGFIVGEGNCDGRDLGARNFDLFHFARLGVFDGALGFIGGAADWIFIPVVDDVGLVGVKIPTLSQRTRQGWGTRFVPGSRHVVLDVDLGGRTGLGFGD